MITVECAPQAREEAMRTVVAAGGGLAGSRSLASPPGTPVSRAV